jgi:hypothetical protein
MAGKKDSGEISILEVAKGSLDVCILGSTPVILSRMSEKAKHELLFPKGRKSAAEKASSLKHNPYEEFRAAPYTVDEGPTLLAGLSTWFKQSMRGAAVDIPGSSKAQIGRTVWVNGEKVALYGIPKLFMSITRSADINKTPDVRTRAIVPQWACFLNISFIVPLIKEQVVVNLLAAAGLMQGVGDWRPQKGSATYGQFEIVSMDDKRFQSIVKNGGRAVQTKAMEDAECYDSETAELLGWFDVETKRRGFKVVE